LIEGNDLRGKQLGLSDIPTPSCFCTIKYMITTMQVLLASKLFTSKNEVNRAKSVKINRVAVDNANDQIENGDFLAALFLPNGIDMIKKKQLVISNGKKHFALIQITDDSIQLLT
jgi:hypothetical protein